MKKLTGFILTFVLISFAFSAQAKKLDENFDMMLRVLQETEVIENDQNTEFDGEKTVTRAEFSEMVGKMLKAYPNAEVEYFKDVPREYYQAGYINVLTEMGIISYNDAQIFEPDRAIRYEEACKMLLCAIGYGDYALLQGAPMSVYASVAAEAEINTTVSDTNALSAKEAVTMLFKAMNAPVMRLDDGELKVDTEANVFGDYHSVYFDEGVVFATDFAYCEKYTLQSEGHAVIGNEEFATDVSLDSFLGIKTVYAYKYDKEYGEGKILYAYEKDAEDFLELESGQISDFYERTNTITYYPDKNASKTKSEKIQEGFQLILNGAPYDKSLSPLIESFKEGTRRGFVKLADSDSDGGFDIVIVKSYELLPSATIDTNDENIYGGFEKKTISYKDFDRVRYVDTFGAEKELINLSDGVLNVAESQNKEVLEVVLCTDTATLEIASVMADESKITAKDGTTYDMDKRVMAEYKDLLFSYKSVKVYFDNFGYIVKLAPEAKGDLVTGYLINGRYFENDEGAEEIQLNVYTKDKKIVRFKLSERAEIDEISYNMSKNPKAVISAIPNTWENGNIISVSPQVIRYKVNEAGEIIKLDTENLTTSEDANNSLVLRHKGASMLNSNRVGLDTYWAADKTDVFTIPELNSEGLVKKNGVYTEPSASDFSTSVSLSFDESYTVDTYNYSDVDYYVGVMVVVKEQATRVNDALVFTGTSKVWDENEGKTLTVVECYRGGSKASFKLNDGVEVDLKDFKYGDLFYIMLDGTGAYGTEIKKIFDTETMRFVHTSDNDYWYYGSYNPYSNWSYRTGENNRNNLSRMYVLKKRNGAIFGSYEFSGLADGKYEEIMKIGSLPVVIVDRENKNVEKGTFESILSYEEVGDSAPLTLVESKTQVAKSVIIYK